jgi:PAT family beta-lactamase induction signal transducer AmpG
MVTARVPEPIPAQMGPGSMRDAVRQPLADFFNRMGRTRALCILLFILLYRLGDAMINNMTTPFLLDLGFSQTDVGIVQGGIGLAATIAGVLAGGAIISRIGINGALWMFGFLQALSNFAYLILSRTGRNFTVMVGTIIVEHFCTGLGTAALVGFLMVLCNPRFSATQYALLSSLIAVGRDVIAAPSGALAARTGWPAFFFLSVLAAAPGIALLPAIAGWPGRFSTAVCSESPSRHPAPKQHGQNC